MRFSPTGIFILGLAGAAAPALGAPVQFSRCTEFVGVAAADAVRVRALVPMRYQPIVDGAGAKLVVRVADCEAVRVGGLPARAGRVAQIGVIIVSPDGIGTDPNTAINNYTLSYATDSAPLALLLRAAGVPAAIDTGLTIESTPAGSSNEFYAAVSPEIDTGSPTWFLHGTVNTPMLASPFLANWWRYGGGRETKMATDIPTIDFDFGSVMAFTTSRHNLVGRLLPGGNQVTNFQLTFRGAFAEGTMTVTTAPR